MRVLPVLFALLVALVPSATASADAVPNPNCTLIVPGDPLSASGLATPYRFTATDPRSGPCHETNTAQSAFVQAAVINSDNGELAIYNPLVIDDGTTPAAPPVRPNLPEHRVVALWFGYNGDNLALRNADDCVQGLAQMAYCNATALFREAHDQVDDHHLSIPPLGTGSDGQQCPSTRSFAVVDQDQSDNLPTSYLITPSGTLAQNTSANMAAFPGSKVLGNPSDEGLTDKFLDPALGCTPWKVSDLANPGAMVAGLALNELQAGAYQDQPRARVPLNDPFVLVPTFTGHTSLDRVNLYRRGVGQALAENEDAASTETYCRHFREIGPTKLALDRPQFSAFATPNAAVGTNLFTWMASRASGTYSMLNCAALLGKPDRVTLTTNAQGVVTDATIH